MVKNIMIFTFFCFSFLISCKKGTVSDYSNSSSFGFENLVDSYDSKTNTFTRKYNEDTIKVKVYLSDSEIKIILKSFSDNKFLDLSKNIDCSKWGVSPKIYDKLYLNNNEVDYVHNSEVNSKWLCFQGKRFHQIDFVIRKIILQKSEVKALEPSDIYYE